MVIWSMVQSQVLVIEDVADLKILRNIQLVGVCNPPQSLVKDMYVWCGAPVQFQVGTS